MLRQAAMAADGRAVKIFIIGVGKFKRGVDGKIGKQGDGAGNFGQIADAAHVAADDLRHHIATQYAQLARQPGFVKGRLKGLPVGKLLKIFAAQRFAQHRLERGRIKLAVGEMAVEIVGMAAGGVGGAHGVSVCGIKTG